MQTLLLALALLPTATAFGIPYVPEGCMETPGGRVIQKFELNDLCEGDISTSKFLFEEECTDNDAFLLKCYDACVDYGLTLDPPVEYKWADTGNTCGDGPESCFCETACPVTFGLGPGIIAGPCGAEEPEKRDD